MGFDVGRIVARAGLGSVRAVVGSVVGHVADTSSNVHEPCACCDMIAIASPSDRVGAMWRGVARAGVALLLVASCGAPETSTDTSAETRAETTAEAAAQNQLLVVTTVSPITSLVDAIVGPEVNVVGLVPEGANSHTFEPLPSAAEALSQADVIFINGLQLEEPIQQMASDTKQSATQIVALGDAVLAPGDYHFDFSFPESDGKPNPHLWTDPTFVLAYAEVIASTMQTLDPTNASLYEANLAEVRDVVTQLDQAMQVSFATIPDANRVLLTYHDAYAYFAEHYGFTVIGAVQPADFSDPSPKDVAKLITQVREQNVPAIFGSEVFPSPVLDQISVETGGTYVDSLRDDDLPGSPGDPEHSWFGLLRSNYVVMTEALGGDASALLGLHGLVEPGNASYPQ